MISVLSTNITSPSGFTARQNYEALRKGYSSLSSYSDWQNLPVTLTASQFTDEQWNSISVDGFTRFESLAISSVSEALSHIRIDVGSSRTLFILSTTKCNVEQLSDAEENDSNYLSPGQTARKIASYLGFVTDPIVVCNACISGVSAQILADRLITSGFYDYAVVCGADCLTPFTVAGFFSFKSLSQDECRPFDIDRNGLNPGEAAATIVFGKNGRSGEWRLCNGCLNNDAFHISAPIPDGDGVMNAILNTIEGFDISELAVICAHGTATMFNDQMESMAIERAGLSDVPVMSLKGYLGHTLGAAGLLETIVTMMALDDGIILPTRGFLEPGVSGRISVVDKETATCKDTFLKIISGFGGCNGAVLFSRHDCAHSGSTVRRRIGTSHTVHIDAGSVLIDGSPVEIAGQGKELLTELYKSRIGDYPKFYKMDLFSRLVFVASELLIQQEKGTLPDGDRSVVLFNSSSSVLADRQHISTIYGREGFYPSPSVFIYTLPNIVTGEIAIRNGYQGETSLLILDKRDDELMSRIVETSFMQPSSGSVLTGWADCSGENGFVADLSIMTYLE